MVKNSTGGKKAKGASRKGIEPKQQATRLAQEGEMYAVVTKFWGGGLVEVKCTDGQTRKCVIRNKFRGRRQRDNKVSLNCALLVGVRDYESKQDTCDLLEVYTLADQEQLGDGMKILFPERAQADFDDSGPAFIENEGEAVAFDDI
jgi:initiation factor 1A